MLVDYIFYLDYLKRAFIILQECNVPKIQQLQNLKQQKILQYSQQSITKMKKNEVQLFNICLLSLVSVFLYLPGISTFQYKYAQVTLDSQTIATYTAYQFTLQRQYTNTFIDTNWRNQPIAAGSTIRIIFPVQYQIINLSQFTCNYIMISFSPTSGYTCALNGHQIIISGLFPSVSNTTDFIIEIGNVLNPAPAISTSPFVAYIGNDYSANDSKAQISFNAAPLQKITSYFTNPLVNTTSNMVFNITLMNYLPVGGSIKIIFPTSLQWARDVSTNHLFPIQGVLECAGISGNLNANISCSGLYSIQTVTLTNIVSTLQTSNSSIIFSINNMFSPPTTEPADQLTIYTLDQNGYFIDTDIFKISGLIPNAFKQFSLGPTGNALLFTVNYYASGLIFNFVLSDTVTKADYFQIHFPSNTTLQYLTYSSLFKITNVIYNSTTRILYMNQTSASQTQYSLANLSLLFVRYKAPPSTRPTDSIILKIMNNGYQKMIGNGKVSALPNIYSFISACNTTKINAQTSLNLSFILSDALNANGMILINIPSSGYVFPNLLSSILVSLTSSISTSFKIASNPSSIFAYNFGQTIKSVSNQTQKICNYSKCLILLGLSSSGSQISAQNINIVISGLSNIDHVGIISPVSFQTYYDSQFDSLVATGSQSNDYYTTNGYLTINSLGLSSLLTNTLCSIQINIKTQNKISPNGYLQILIPAKDILVDLSLLFGNIQVDVSINGITYFTNQIAKTNNNNTANSISVQFLSNSSYFLFSINFNSTSSISAQAVIIIKINNVLSQLKTGLSAGFLFYTFNAQSQMIDANIQTSHTISTSVPIQQVSSSFAFYSLDNLYSENSTNISQSFLQNSNFQCLKNDQKCNNILKIVPSVPFVINSVNLNYIKIAYKNFTKAFGYDLSGLSHIYLGVKTLIQINTDQNEIIIFQNTLSNGQIKWISCQFLIIDTTNIDQQQILINLPSFSTIYSSYSLSKTSYFRSLSLPSLNLSSQIYLKLKQTSNPYSLKESLIDAYIFSSQASMVNYSSLSQNLMISEYSSFQTLVKNQAAATLLINNYFFDNLIWGDYSSGIQININLANWKFQTINSTQNEQVKFIYIVFGTDFAQNTSSLTSSLACSTTDSVVTLTCSVFQTISLSQTNAELNNLLDLSSFTVVVTLVNPNELKPLSSLTIMLSTFSNPQYPGILNLTLNKNLSISLFSLSESQYLVHLLSNQIIFTSSCNYPCKQCYNQTVNASSSLCKSCFDGMILYKQSCYSLCPKGTIQILNANQSACTQCSIKCQICYDSPDFCISCNSSSQYKYLYVGTTSNSSTCLAVCPATYFVGGNTTNQICQQCQTNCTTCQNSIKCLICSSPLYVYNGNCIQNCLIGTFINTNTTVKICQDCKSLFNNCYYCNQSICLICDPTYYIYDNGLCVLACQNSYFSGSDILLIQTGNYSYETCKKCNLACQNCVNQSNICISCPINITNQTFLYQNKCKNKCPVQTYPDISNNTCENCSSLNINCINCSSNSTCYTCDTPYLYFPINESCILQNQVPDGFLVINNTILECSQNCSNCAVSIQNCTSCKNGYYYFSPQGIGCCTLDCPLTTYKYQFNNFKQCVYCPYPCFACQYSQLINFTQCLSCQLNSSLFYYNLSCVTAAQCPNDTFPSSQQSKCLKCQSNCFLCQNDGTTCQTCSTNFYLFNQTCIIGSLCPLGTISVIQSNSSLNNFGSCVACPLQCKSCSININNCTSCKSTYFYNNFTNECLTNCYQPLIQDLQNMRCAACTPPCLFCINTTTTCTACQLGYYYLDSANKCYTENKCPNGYYTNVTLNACVSCLGNCSVCTLYVNQSLLCNKCTNPSVLYNGSCIDACPTNSPINNSGICSTCLNLIAGCFNCSLAVASSLQIKSSSSFSCLNCYYPYILLNGICYLKCPTGYIFEQSSNRCLTDNQYADNNLNNTLSTNSIFPMPLTIIGAVIFIACIMSKLQNDNSYFIGTVYSLLGLLQTCSIGYLLVRLTIYLNSQLDNWDSLFLLFQVVIGWIFLTNILGLFIQTPMLCKDIKFSKWFDNHSISYLVTIILSVTISYKFKMILFTRLFSFKCFRAQLDEIQKFRIFNILSFIGVGYEGLFLYATALTLNKFSFHDQLFLVIVDVAVIFFINLVLALAVAKKQQNFFQQSEDGITLNKKVQVKSEQQKSHLKVFNEYINQKTGGMQSLNKLVQDIIQDQQFSLSMSRDSNEEDKNSDQDKSAKKLKVNCKSMISDNDQKKAKQITNKQKKLKQSALFAFQMPPQKMQKLKQDHPITIFQQQQSKQREKSQILSQRQVKKNIFDQMDLAEEREIGEEQFLNQNQLQKFGNSNKEDKLTQDKNTLQEDNAQNTKVQTIIFQQDQRKVQGQFPQTQNELNKNTEKQQVNLSKQESSKPNIQSNKQKQVKVYRGRQRVKDKSQDQQITSALKNKRQQLENLKKSRQKLQIKRSRSKSLSKININKNTIQKSQKYKQVQKKQENQNPLQKLQNNDQKIDKNIKPENNSSIIDFTNSLVCKDTQNANQINQSQVKQKKIQQIKPIQIFVNRKEGNFFDTEPIQQVSMIKNTPLTQSLLNQNKLQKNQHNLDIQQEIQLSKFQQRQSNLKTQTYNKLIEPIGFISEEDISNFQRDQQTKNNQSTKKQNIIDDSIGDNSIKNKSILKSNKQFYLTNSQIQEDQLIEQAFSNKRQKQIQKSNKKQSQQLQQQINEIVNKKQDDINLQEFKDLFKKRLRNSSSKKNISQDQDENIKQKQKNKQSQKNFVSVRQKGKTQPFKIKDVLDNNQKEFNLPLKSKVNYPLSTSRQKYQFQNSNDNYQNYEDQLSQGNKTFDSAKRRPPRPISSQKTQKSRMYFAGITGVKNIQYQKSSNISSSVNQISPTKIKPSKNIQNSTVDKRNMTTYNIPFSKMNSNQLSNFSSENQNEQVDLLMMQTNKANNFYNQPKHNSFNQSINSSKKLNQERSTNQIPRKPKIAYSNPSNQELQKEIQKRNQYMAKQNSGANMNISRKKSIQKKYQHIQEQAQTKRKTSRRSRKEVEQIDVDDLNQYYKRNTRREDLNKSRSKERPMSRESSNKLKSLEKIYLQRLDNKK